MSIPVKPGPRHHIPARLDVPARAPGDLNAPGGVNQVKPPVVTKALVNVADAAAVVVARGDNTQHRVDSNASRLTKAHGARALDATPQGVMLAFDKVAAATPELQGRLEARATRVITSAELDHVATTALLPLAGMLQNTPSGRMWNEATWKAFQATAHLDSAAMGALVQALEKGPMPRNLPPAVAAALGNPAVSRPTLAALLSTRAMTRDVLTAQLPNLQRDEAQSLAKVVHNEGYFRAQAARMTSPEALLCAPHAAPGQLLDAARLQLLSAEVRQRFDAGTRANAAGTEAAFPRLTLADLMAGGNREALQFLRLSGKDVGRPSTELGGQSMEQFLQRQPAETPEAYTSRLAGKQVFNALAMSYEDLEKDARALGAAGGAVDKHLAFLRQKQDPALAPALLLATTPALLAQAAGAQDKLGALMQVCWRVSNPDLPFNNPLVSQGVAQLRTTHAEQLAKDLNLAQVVVHAEKTRALSGLRDDTYDARLGPLLTQRGIPVSSDLVGQALSRLVRDAGADNPRMQAALANVNLAGPEQQVVRELHALRHNPALYPVEVPRGTPLAVGGVKVSFPAGQGAVLPEVVGATTVGYRVKLETASPPLAQGESVLLRVPKGTRLVTSGGVVHLEAEHAGRAKDASARMTDFSSMERRLPITARKAVQVDAFTVVFEKRPQALDAAGRLRAGEQLSMRDAGALADQYIRGLCDVEPKTRPFGVFYELGPDNYVMDKGALKGSYVDVAMQFRTERERGAYGFFQGGYASAANWIVGDNTPMPPERVKDLWHGTSLTPDQQARRNVFGDVLQQRLDPRHPVYQGVPSAVRDAVIQDLHRDARFLGLVTPGT